MRRTPEDDFDRFGFTRHEALSTSSAVAPAVSLVSAPQATFEVTTLADVVDASDGILSLREAIEAANAQPGADTITFADSIRGGTIRFDGGPLTITDDLTIDGDPFDRGAAGVSLEGGSSPTALVTKHFIVRGADLALEDLTLTGGTFASPDLLTVPTGSVLDIERGSVSVTRALLTGNDLILLPDGGSGTPGSFLPAGIRVVDGSIAFQSSALVDNSSVVAVSTAGIFLRSYNSTVVFADSVVADHFGGDFAWLEDGSRFVAERSSFADNWVYQSVVRAQNSDVLIDSSAFIGSYNVGNYGTGGTPLSMSTSPDGDRRELSITNSTIAGNGASYSSGIIDLSGNIDAAITNSTITGNFIGAYYRAPEPIGGAAISASRGAVVTLENNIVTGNLNIGGGLLELDIETLVSNGANIFGDVAVPGAAAGDRLGVDARDVFAVTEVLRAPDFLDEDRVVLVGVAADNGGPTLTVALLSSPDNPALDAADLATAPATDQRGFLRDATPDIGAFELGAEPPTVVPPLPPLAEGGPVPDEAINSVPREALTLTGGRDAAISFVDEYAGFQNSLGVYLVGPNGEIMAPRWVFERIEHALPDDSVDPSVRPGGGPSQPGDTVLLSDLYDPQELQEGLEFGLFLLADGAARNPFIVFDHGRLEFRSGGGVAKVTNTTPELVHIAETGFERALLGDIMHTVDAGSPNPLSNKLNPPAVRYPVGGRGQALSGLLDGEFTIAFEDQPLNFGDRDFNDLLVTVDLLDGGDAKPAAPTAVSAPAVADLQVLVSEGEVV